MTLWDPMGFGLAFSSARETDRGLQGRSRPELEMRRGRAKEPGRRRDDER